MSMDKYLLELQRKMIFPKALRKLPEKEVYSIQNYEKLKQQPQLKNVPMYIMAGCGKFGHIIILFVPNQVNWEYYEADPEKYPELMKPYGYFEVMMDERYRDELLKKGFHTFSGGNLFPKSKLKKKIDEMKNKWMSDTFIREKFSCNVDTICVVPKNEEYDDPYSRPYKITISGVKSKLFNETIVLRLQSPIHDYQNYTINKKFFNRENLSKFPVCGDLGDKRPTDKKLSIPKNDEGYLFTLSKSPNKGKPLKKYSDSNILTLFVRHQKRLFSDTGMWWKISDGKIITNGEFGVHLSAHLSGDEHFIGLDENPKLMEMITKKQKFIDEKMGSSDEYGYISLVASFSIKPDAKIERWNSFPNTVFMHEFEIKKHFFEPIIPFKKFLIKGDFGYFY